MIKAEVINQVSQEALLKKLNNSIDNASGVLVNEIARVSKNFTPYRNGGLFASLKYEKDGGRYTGISYSVPYAKRVWYGNDNWQYTTTQHSQACPRWILRAFEVYKSEVIKKTQGAMQ